MPKLITVYRVTTTQASNGGVDFESQYPSQVVDVPVEVCKFYDGTMTEALAIVYARQWYPTDPLITTVQ